MRTYELLYIIPATLTDDEVAQTETDIQALIQKYGGTPKESRRLGKFRFTYLIKKIRYGHYVLVYFDAESEAVAKIHEALRIHERIVRHLVLRADEAGGNEFNLVQFQEVQVDGSKDDRGKRKRQARKDDVADDVKEAASLEENSENKDLDEDSSKEAADKNKAPENADDGEDDGTFKLSAEELDKKINAALSDSTDNI
ncbi:MAG: 30S ribosomal protein S6 [Patescibacteria group bacterium]